MDLELLSEIEEFQTINLKEFSGYSEDIIESLKLYNNSISYVKYKSEDMALISLKKAIKANEGFLEAHNLLALLYINKGEYPNAVDCINKVLDVDEENQKAIKYIQYIKEKNNDIEVRSNKIVEEQESKSNKNNKEKKEETKNFKNKDINKSDKVDNKTKKTEQAKKINIFEKYKDIEKKRNRILTIAYSLLAVSMILILFATLTYFVNNKQNPNEVVKKEKSQTSNIVASSSSSDVEASLNDEYDKPIKEVKETKKKKVKIETKQKQDSAMSINNANKYLLAKNFDMSADELRKIDKIKLTEQEKQQYQQVANKIYATTGQQNRQKGEALYNSGNFNEAIVYLERYVLAEKKDQFRAWDLYYLAKSYRNIGNKLKSNEYIYKIKSEYPNSEQAGYADSWKNRNP